MKIILYILVWAHLLYAEHNHTNALITEDSPYLQQHAHNPVNWYPWGEEAFEKAKRESKLIFVSIGYSTCHWCHVMEEESFTDLEIATLLNDDFISIKVDREAYPQIDKKYQSLYMDVYGERGGWPLSVFLSPSKKVFFIGTYIPKEEAYGSKGLMYLLPSFIALQKDKKAFGKSIQKYKKRNKDVSLKNTRSLDIANKVVNVIAMQFDVVNGGFAKRPKFPEASKLELLLDIYTLNGNQKAFYMAEKTLRKMAEGGIYDQIRGGFFRYTTDHEWQIPHFEKMLYTTAELIPVYVKLYKMTGDALYKRVLRESIDQMEKNFMEEGVYLSASDADSNGEEGGYFIYEYLEVKHALLQKGFTLNEVEAALSYLGIEEDGNIDGDFSHAHIMSQKIPSRLEEVKNYLRMLRKTRTFPFVDKKVITAWNAMMIKALFSASELDNRYLPLAKEHLASLLKRMRKNKVLYHQSLLGKAVKQKSLLEDYAFLMDALIEGYEKTYDQVYLTHLDTLASESLQLFYKNKRWYLSHDGIEAVADFDDRYYTSALSKMLEDLLRLSSLSGNLRYADVVKQTIETMGAVLEQNPADASKLVHTFIRLKRGDIIVKAKKEKLQKSREAIESIQYPFVLSKSEESDKYLACKINSCFAYDTNITALIEKIHKVVEK